MNIALVSVSNMQESPPATMRGCHRFTTIGNLGISMFCY